MKKLKKNMKILSVVTLICFSACSSGQFRPDQDPVVPRGPDCGELLTACDKALGKCDEALKDKDKLIEAHNEAIKACQERVAKAEAGNSDTIGDKILFFLFGGLLGALLFVLIPR